MKLSRGTRESADTVVAERPDGNSAQPQGNCLEQEVLGNMASFEQAVSRGTAMASAPGDTASL
jgi:hypothetical protein